MKENKIYEIFVDASANIDPIYATKDFVHIIPMGYIEGENISKCVGNEDEETLKKFYDNQRNGGMVKTSQTSPQEYIEVFEPLVKDGIDILYIALSSGLSGTYQSANLAANEIMEKYKDSKVIVVDSLGATAGMGLLTERAVENLKNGLSIEENEKDLNESRHRLCHWFIVEDLEYLRRGGRISPTTEVIGKTLNIKPILKLNEEGKIVSAYKKRGIKSAIKQLAKLYEVSSEKEENERVYIIHADEIENANLLENAILEKNEKCKITKMMLSPNIGAHTGPGMVGVFYYKKSQM